MNHRILVVCLLILLLACSQKETSPPGQTLNDVMQADSTGDPDKVVALYTDDAILIPSGNSDIVGKTAIRENYRNIFANSSLQLKSTANEIIQSSDWTIIRGNTSGNILSKKDSLLTPVNDKFLMILKKQSGKWKIYRLMWNKNSEP